MKKTEEKQFKELTEEELQEVTGGGCSKWEITCPDGRKVSSITQCAVLAALEVMQVNQAEMEVGVQMTALGE